MRRVLMGCVVVGAFLAGLAVMAWWGPRVPNGDTGPLEPAASGEREVLYWYDPMLPQHRFDAPGKSPFMDMMLVPKYAGDAGDSGSVTIDPRLVQNLGVRAAPAVLDRIDRSVQANGEVAFNEREIAVVQARVDAIVERLHVRATLDPVKAGQPLLALIAPEWTAAQEEYLSLRRARTPDIQNFIDAARRRLLLLGMSEAQISAIERSGRSDTRIVIHAPRDGVVAELAVREGARVMAGLPLLTINGLSTVWVNAAVPEASAGIVSKGAKVIASVPAYPGQRFEGTVDAVLPSVDSQTRTLSARIVLDNLDQRLTPGMFVALQLRPVDAGPRCVLVPTEAVIATGTRQAVIVAEGRGRFRAQEVRVGIESGGRSEILEGVEAGEEVVLSGQFLIDSEASLRGALARLSGASSASDRTEPLAERHAADGVVTRIEADAWTIDTGPVPSLQMGAMGMSFVPPLNPSDIAVGERVRFTFFRNADGAFEIEDIASVDALEDAPLSLDGSPG
ncbi:MAG: efflux RND transporter periplasmic adaptor subunit, partial [Gammaproteobacteria bacterium]|nr:efflux RND transporter periplasmic adaptor subunit [Gammaproteobacteria bacterium]